MIVRFVVAISMILFARFTGAKEYGIFSVAIAFTSVVVYFTDAGLSQTFLREGTKKEGNLGVLISSYLRVRLILALIVTIFTLFFGQILYHDSELINIVYWMVIPTIYGAIFQGVGTIYFQVIEKMGFNAIIQIMQGLGNVTALILGMLFNFSLLKIAILFGLSSIFVGIVAIFLVTRHIKIHKGWDKRILAELLTFTINGVILMIIPQLGPLILQKVTSLEEVGYFSTAFKIPSVLYQIPAVIAVAFYPRLFSYGNKGDRETHRKLSLIELKLMSFLGFGAALPFIVNPYFWIITILGKEWIPSAVALSILSVLVIFHSLNYPMADFLTTTGNQKKRTIIMSTGLLVAILSYSILGSSFGMIGGAFAPILTEIIILIGLCIFVPRGFSFLAKGVFINLIGALVAISIYFLVLYNLYPIISFILLEMIYLIIIIICDKEIFQQLKVLLYRFQFKKNKLGMQKEHN
ncbi:sugar translocase [Bacillus sp. FJAT-27225]|nr:sugar translocase [Bacillus sp. FJAT-27225]